MMNIDSIHFGLWSCSPSALAFKFLILHWRLLKADIVMDNNPWLWKRSSAQRTVNAAANNYGSPGRGVPFEEARKIPAKSGTVPSRIVKNLNEKLASVILDDQQAKHDQFLVQHEIEISAGLEKDEEEIFLKKELTEEDLILRQGAPPRKAQPDAAMKHFMWQLSTIPEEQELKMEHEATGYTHPSPEYDLEKKLMDTSKRLANLVIENTNLSRSLMLKEKMVDELHKQASQTSAEFDALMSRLDTTEKENAFLKYEFHMLEKEIEVRNEELTYSRQSADASRMQHLECVKTVAKLEAECQMLRSSTRKRLPGPASNVRNRNPGRELSIVPETNVNFLLEENRTLKETLRKKNAELHSSRSMFSRSASRLSQAEAQLAELSRGTRAMELMKYSPVPKELYPIASSDICSDDGVSSSSGSWASALLSELEHFRYGKVTNSRQDCNAIGNLDMSLMDDFVEMEKFAIVSVGDDSSMKNVASGNDDDGDDQDFDWLQVVLKALIKQQRVSKRSLPELLEDVRIAIGDFNPSNTHKDGKPGKECVQSENQRLKDELKVAEAKLQSETEKTEALINEARDLRAEIESIRDEKSMVDDQLENQKSMNEDLDTQLTVAKSKLNEIMQKYSCLEVELEDKNDCCEELESTCLDLQLQLESVSSNETINNSINEEEKQSSQTGWEITAASAKLAECQETILNLGKQLKALASPKEAALFDKVFNATNGADIVTTTTNNRNFYRHFSLHDQMVAEDKAKAIILYSPKEDSSLKSADQPDEVKGATECDGNNKTADMVTLAIVPTKRQAGIGFWKKLLMRRKKGGSKRSQTLVKV
ncbi:Filament-like plant protein 7 [Linum perenne]